MANREMIRYISTIGFIILFGCKSFSAIIDSSLAFNLKYKNFEIVWNDSIATVKNITNEVIDTIFIDYEDYDTTESSHYYVIQNYYMLSVVGPYISYGVDYEGDGGAHPSYGTEYYTYNIETKKELALNEIFRDEAIFISILDNEEISKYLYGHNPKNLKDLIEHLNGNCEIQFHTMLNNFAFFDFINSKIVIEFGLTHGCEVMRGYFSSFEITLEIPKEQLDIFTQAAKDKLLLKHLATNIY